MKVFIGGSKSIGKLNKRTEKMLNALIRNNHHILIGDCYGADLAVQRFLRSQGYKNVTVYTACHLARHNEGCWKEVIIKTEKTGFAAHRKKDIAMAGNCDFGIMIWDGESKGTHANIKNLKRLGKRTVIINEII